MAVIIPKTFVSETIFQGGNIYKVDVTIYFTGTIDFEITANADATTPNWEKVALLTGVKSSHTFAVLGANVKYRIVAMGAVISAQQETNGNWESPGIKIKAYYN